MRTREMKGLVRTLTAPLQVRRAPALRRRRSWRVTGAVAVAGALLTCAAGAQAAPVWNVYTAANTTAPPGGSLEYFVQITNVGDEASSGPTQLEVTLPAGMTGVATVPPSDGTSWDCPAIAGATTFTCASPDPISPHLSINATLVVDLEPFAAGTLTSSFEVTGGGAAAAASTVDPTTVSSSPASFGIDAFDGQVTADAAGQPDTQAGGHPYAATTWIDFNRFTNPNPALGSAWPVAPVKDVLVDLPPGLVGNPAGVAECTLPELANAESVQEKPLCSPASQVGTGLLAINGGFFRGDPLAVYNMVPPPNVPARFGFNFAGTVVTLDAELRSGGDYGLSVNARNISQGLAITGTKLTFWGVPADPSHDHERSCPGQNPPFSGGPTCTTDAKRTWFLRNPTACTPTGVGLLTSVSIDSWVDPGRLEHASFVSHLPAAYPFAPTDRGIAQGPSSCERVPFQPALDALPAVPTDAGAPTAFTFDLALPRAPTRMR